MQGLHYKRPLLLTMAFLVCYLTIVPLALPPVDSTSIAIEHGSRGHIVIPEPLTLEEQIDIWVEEICSNYNVNSSLVKSMIWHESRYRPDARNGNCLGLMQISTRWHQGRAERLGVTDFFDPYSNILLGVDYISELLTKYKDPALALMAYNMGPAAAVAKYRSGEISGYAKSVLARADHI